jgi:hypothetical protein
LVDGPKPAPTTNASKSSCFILCFWLKSVASSRPFLCQNTRSCYIPPTQTPIFCARYPRVRMRITNLYVTLGHRRPRRSGENGAILPGTLHRRVRFSISSTRRRPPERVETEVELVGHQALWASLSLSGQLNPVIGVMAFCREGALLTSRLFMSITHGCFDRVAE